MALVSKSMYSTIFRYQTMSFSPSCTIFFYLSLKRIENKTEKSTYFWLVAKSFKWPPWHWHAVSLSWIKFFFEKIGALISWVKKTRIIRHKENKREMAYQLWHVFHNPRLILACCDSSNLRRRRKNMYCFNIYSNVMKRFFQLDLN